MMFNTIKRHFCQWNKVYQQHAKLRTHSSWPRGMRRYLDTQLPDAAGFVAETPLLALDFETSGVDARYDQILSIGWVPMTTQSIDVSQSKEFNVRYNHYVNARSAEIHQLMPNVLAEGTHLDDAMDHLFGHLAGRVALVHGACIEKAFLDHYVQRKYGLDGFPCLWIDTLKIEKSLTFSGKTRAKTNFQLSDLRADYCLPHYTGHSAAIDALSAGELFTAQLKSIFRGESPRLDKLICL